MESAFPPSKRITVATTSPAGLASSTSIRSGGWDWRAKPDFFASFPFVEGVVSSDEHVTEASYLGGLRIALSPRAGKLTPYAKLLAGAGEITLPYGYAHGGFLTYAPGAGLDLALNDRLTVRAVDFEYQHWPQFTFGALSPYGLSAGLSLRLNTVSRFPNGARAHH